LIILCFSRFVN